MEKDVAVEIVGLKKQYRLGTIGGGTLAGDLKRAIARKRGKSDPLAKIGEMPQYPPTKHNEIFKFCPKLK